MNINHVLGIARSGLAAATQGTAVASQNITNSATDGYSRRIVNLQPVPLSQGGGVQALPTTRAHDAFLDRRTLSTSGQSGAAGGRVETLQVLDNVFADETGGLGDSISAFETAISDFSTSPNDASTRQALLAKTEQLSQAFNQASGALSDARGSANQTIADTVQNVNRQIEDIANITHQIAIAAGRGEELGDLQDSRDRMVRELGKNISVNTVEDQKGGFTLMLDSSYTLVDSTGTAHELKATLDPGSGDVRIYRNVSGVDDEITNTISGGKLAGVISARDGALKDAQTSLDQLAFDMARSYNDLHSQGVGLDGQTGRNLFNPLTDVAGAAHAIGLSSDVKDNPNALAAATSASSLPGDNRNALLMVGLADQQFAAHGTATAQTAFGAISAAAATQLRSAKDRQTQADATATQVENLRQSTYGVSSDDEMISLMRYQRAYQASLRVVETADQMMQDLLNLRR